MNSEALKEDFSTLRSVAEFLVDYYNSRREDFLKQKRIFEAIRRDLSGVLKTLYKAENEAVSDDGDDDDDDDDDDVICLGQDLSNEEEQQGEDKRVVVRKRCRDDDVESCPGDIKRQCQDDLSQVNFFLFETFFSFSMSIL